MSRVNSVMSTKEFRPRPIDINQPLPIISDEKLLNEIEKETISIARAPPPVRPKSKLTITVATPLFREVEDNKTPNAVRFSRPQNYIAYQKEQHYSTDVDELEYELDSSDELFLAALNSRIKARHAHSRQLRSRSSPSPSSSKSPSPSPSPSSTATASVAPKLIKPRREVLGVTGITDDMLEQLINGLEKEAFFVYGLRQMRDNTMDGILCCVCNDHEGDNGNTLVLCDGCNMPVHQHCYGICELPVATWLCSHCLSNEANAVCVLCGGRYGGMKPTTDGRWAHVLCALWFPEVSYKDPILLDPIDGIDNIHADRWNKKCSLCNDTRGVCVVCDEPSCNTQFHVGCARVRGLFVEPKPDGDKIVMTAYCAHHSLNHLEHYPTFPRDLEHPLGNETALVAKAMGLTEEDYDLIYSYWRIKRRGHPPPLLRRLRTMITEGYTMRMEGMEAEEEYRVRFVKLRQDFERARMLLDLVRKRELAKRQLLDSLHSLIVYHTPQNGFVDGEDDGGDGDNDSNDHNDDPHHESSSDKEGSRRETGKPDVHHYPKRLRH